MKSVMMFVPEGSGSAAKPRDGSARSASTAVTPRAVRAIRAMAPRAQRLRPDPVTALEYREHYERWTAVGAGLERLGHLL